jgi:hypothetical protein
VSSGGRDGPRGGRPQQFITERCGRPATWQLSRCSARPPPHTHAAPALSRRSKQQTNGFICTQSLLLTVEPKEEGELDAGIAAALQATLTAGGDLLQVSSMESDLSAELRRSATNQAREAAVADAEETAGVLAKVSFAAGGRGACWAVRAGGGAIATVPVPAALQHGLARIPACRVLRVPCTRVYAYPPTHTRHTPAGRQGDSGRDPEHQRLQRGAQPAHAPRQGCVRQPATQPPPTTSKRLPPALPPLAPCVGAAALPT